MRVIAAQYPVPKVPEQIDGKQPGSIQPAPAEPVDVPDNSYYRRRIASGELLLVVEGSAKLLAMPMTEAQPSGRGRAKSTAKGGEQ